jgi:hypothetical protein
MDSQQTNRDHSHVTNIKTKLYKNKNAKQYSIIYVQNLVVKLSKTSFRAANHTLISLSYLLITILIISGTII